MQPLKEFWETEQRLPRYQKIYFYYTNKTNHLRKATALQHSKRILSSAWSSKCASESSFYQVGDRMPCWHRIHKSTGLHLASWLWSHSKAFGFFLLNLLLHSTSNNPKQSLQGLTRARFLPLGFIVISYRTREWVPPLTSTRTLRTFLFAAKRISDKAAEKSEIVLLVFTVTAFAGGDGSLSLSSL